MSDPHTVRAAGADDAAGVAAIYNHFVTTSVVTFEEEPVTAEEVARRIAQVQSSGLPWLVTENERQIIGYAYATAWKTRASYRFSVELTVYVAPGWTGRGIGSLLYAELLRLLRVREVHAVIGGIALPNDASVALHEKFGFQKVAHFREVGFKFNRWVDVGYWELMLARD